MSNSFVEVYLGIAIVSKQGGRLKLESTNKDGDFNQRIVFEFFPSMDLQGVQGP